MEALKRAGVGSPQRSSPLQVQLRCCPKSSSLMMGPGPADWVEVVVVAGLCEEAMDRAVAVASRLKEGKPYLQSLVYNYRIYSRIGRNFFARIFNPS